MSTRDTRERLMSAASLAWGIVGRDSGGGVTERGLELRLRVSCLNSI